MWNNYLKYTWRSLTKNKTYSLLNIIGLSAGLTCFALIALWVTHELSYDKFNKNYDRIVRLTGVTKTESGISEAVVSSAPMAKALKDDYPEVENTVRFDMRAEELVLFNGQQVLQQDILVTDPSFFDVFSYHLTKGDKTTALNEPYSIILTKSTAKKYFGDADPMGQTLTIYMYDSAGRGANYKVTGVMPDPPKNAHFSFNMLSSFKTVEVANPDILTADGWGDASFYTYLLLKKDVDYKSFSNKISQFYGKYIGELFNVWRNIYFYKLQPLGEIHLRSNLQYEIAVTGDINKVYIFSIIGIFILLLAGINYINLATARSVERAKEVGIKKVVGAVKGQLILQYLSEAVLVAMTALIGALLFSALVKPMFSQITGKDISVFSSPALMIFLVIVTILLGVLSGLYPALIISGFKPVSVLKGSFKTSHRGILLRKSLVVAQFAITLVLITGIIVIFSQMSFIKHKQLGYDKDGLIFLRVNGNADVINGFEAFKNELLTNTLVSGVATANSLPVGGFGSGGSETVNNNGEPLQVNTARLRVDQDFLRVYGIKLIAGKDFLKNAINDSIRPVIINEMAVKKFGWQNAEAAIGKPFRMGERKGVITAVVKDFHFNSLQEMIEPLAIYPRADNFSRITVRADVSKAGQSVAWIEKAWKKHFPSALLDYNFMDSQIGEQYQAEDRFLKLFSYFSILSLLIACLGLYGLITYSTSQRTKEIGVRKVLGASVRGIAFMLSKSFLKLVVLAFLIAVPIGWFIMNKWLQDFAYRTTISWWMFATSGLIVILIALLTVSFKAIKAAIANPIKSLRTE